MKTDYKGALAQIGKRDGLWLLHGDEPLLAQMIIDQARAHWQKNGVERHRLDLNSPKDWQEALGLLDNLSLFASNTAVELHGQHKPEPKVLEQLIAFMHAPAGNLLLVNMPKQDSAAQKTKFFKAVEQDGVVANLVLYQDRDRQAVLATIAKQLQLNLTADAWSMLLEHSQNNLLAAHQVLLRLQLGLPDPTQAVDVNILQPTLSEQSRFSTFDLADAMLQGQRGRMVQILRFLQESDEPASLVLWTLNKEMKTLIQLAENPQAAQQLGIWPSRLPMYQGALRRLSPTQMHDWPDLLRRCDEAIKGVSGEVAWDVLLQTALAGTGVRLFSDSSHN